MLKISDCNRTLTNLIRMLVDYFNYVSTSIFLDEQLAYRFFSLECRKLATVIKLKPGSGCMNSSINDRVCFFRLYFTCHTTDTTCRFHLNCHNLPSLNTESDQYTGFEIESAYAFILF